MAIMSLDYARADPSGNPRHCSTKRCNALTLIIRLISSEKSSASSSLKDVDWPRLAFLSGSSPAGHELTASDPCPELLPILARLKFQHLFLRHAGALMLRHLDILGCN